MAMWGRKTKPHTTHSHQLGVPSYIAANREEIRARIRATIAERAAEEKTAVSELNCTCQASDTMILYGRSVTCPASTHKDF